MSQFCLTGVWYEIYCVTMFSLNDFASKLIACPSANSGNAALNPVWWVCVGSPRSEAQVHPAGCFSIISNSAISLPFASCTDHARINLKSNNPWSPDGRLNFSLQAFKKKMKIIPVQCHSISSRGSFMLQTPGLRPKGRALVTDCASHFTIKFWHPFFL